MDDITISFLFIWDLLSKPFIELNGNSVSIFSLVVFMFLLWASFAAGSAAEKFIEKILRRRGFEKGVSSSIERIARYIVVVVGIFISLGTIGFNLSSLAAFGAILGVGIGFGLQNITQNFISGLIILLERPIKKGDMVEVKGVRGRVLEIQARSTLVATRDDVVIIVPNSQFISEQVVNDSFSGEKIRISLKIGVAYGSDVELVTKILRDIGMSHEKVLKDPSPTIQFKDFGDSSLDFMLLVWVEDLWDRELILSDLRYEVDKKFRVHKVQIPFPQRDIHIVSQNLTN